jgi:glutathione S-transferase
MFAGDLHPLIVPRIRKYLTQVAGFDDQAWRAWQVNWYSHGLTAAERRLSSEPETGRFCHGDQPGLADICLAGAMTWARMQKISVASIPTLERVMANCAELAAFKESHPLLQPGAPKA